jgi:hypothetical protein
MNFKHILIIVAVAIVGIVAFKFFTKTDRSDPMAVANGFTAQIKDRDFEGAAEFMAPDARAAWLEATNKRFETMKSGSMDNYFASIPAEPGFTAAPPVKGAPALPADKMNVVSADRSYSLELAQVDGDWYVAKAPN